MIIYKDVKKHLIYEADYNFYIITDKRKEEFTYYVFLNGDFVWDEMEESLYYEEGKMIKALFEKEIIVDET